MTPRRDTFDLLMRHLDGRLSGDDLRALNDLLRTDARARDWLREIAGQAVAMGDLARSRTAERPAAVAGPARSPRWFAAPAWAALAVASVGLMWWWAGPARRSAALVDVSGSVLWSDGGTGPQPVSASGARLHSGTLETVGAVSSAQLRFDDGTWFTLGGNSELSFSAVGATRVHLRGGSLTAWVARQPPGRPLVVRTPTAEVEVLGTEFAVNTVADQTQLNVETGRVRLRRLVDGRVVEVAARHEAVASLDAQQPLVAVAPAVPPGEWNADLASAPTGGSKGEPIAATGARPACWRAVPLVMGRRAAGSPVIHHGISVRETSRSPAGSFVSLSSDSEVVLRWRTDRPSGLFVFLITQRPGGGFGGNFEIKTAALAGSDDGGGWRRAALPLRDFRPLHPGRAAFAGHGVSAVLVTTYGTDAGLEVAAVRIGSARP